MSHKNYTLDFKEEADACRRYFATAKEDEPNSAEAFRHAVDAYECAERARIGFITDFLKGILPQVQWADYAEARDYMSRTLELLICELSDFKRRTNAVTSERGRGEH